MLLDTVKESETKIINNSDANTYDIKSFIDKKSDTTNNKIDSIRCGDAVNKFNVGLAQIGDSLTLRSTVDAFEKVSDSTQYQANKDYVDDTFQKLYSAEDKDSRYLFKAFESASNFITGENIEGEHISLMDLKKKVLNANDKFFDNETLNDREKYLTQVAKTYISQYTALYNLVSFENTTCTRKWLAGYAEKAPQTLTNITAKDFDGDTPFTILEGKVRANTKDNYGREIKGIDTKYNKRILDSEQDLKKLEDMYNKALKQLRVEFAKINFEKENEKSSNKMFIVGNRAYQINKVYNSDTYGATLLGLGANNHTTNDDWFNLASSVKRKEGDWGINGIKETYNWNYDNLIRKQSLIQSTIRNKIVEDKMKNSQAAVRRWIQKFNEQCNKQYKSTTPLNKNYLVGRILNLYNSQQSIKLGGILVGEGNVSCKEYGTFTRNLKYKSLLIKKSSKNVSVISGCKITKELHYIDNENDARGKTTVQSRELNFANGTNTVIPSGDNVKLGIIDDVTSIYKVRLQRAIDAAMKE